MKLMKAGAVQVVVLVVAMLAAIGGWEVSKAVVQHAYGGTPPQVVFDHFTCYKVHDLHPETGFVAKVQLTNQFETSISRVKDEDRVLCTPTAKTLLSLTVTKHPDDDGHDGDNDKGKKK